MIKTVH